MIGLFGKEGEMTLEHLTKEALKQWGRESQLDMVIEECAELIDAIQKWRRGRVEASSVLEEGVDVELCLEQLKSILNDPYQWESVSKMKLERLQGLLEKVEKP